MSDLQPQFTVTVPVVQAASTTVNLPVTLPFDADLVAISAALQTAGSGISTIDVQKNGSTVFSANAQMRAGGDAGATLTSNKIQFAADSTSKTSGVVTQKTSVNASATGADQNFVSSGVNIITAVVPADAVIASFSSGSASVNVDRLTVVSVTGAAATNPSVVLHFVRK